MLPEIARRHGTRVIELGIVQNHVHMVLELPPRLDIARLVQGLKGASARIANRDGVMTRARLRWADGYDLRSLGVRDLKRAIRYVRTQQERHPDLALRESPG
jgi:putative transposase